MEDLEILIRNTKAKAEDCGCAASAMSSNLDDMLGKKSLATSSHQDRGQGQMDICYQNLKLVESMSVHKYIQPNGKISCLHQS